MYRAIGPASCLCHELPFKYIDVRVTYTCTLIPARPTRAGKFGIRGMQMHRACIGAQDRAAVGFSSHIRFSRTSQFSVLDPAGDQAGVRGFRVASSELKIILDDV
jgi:hypothetical protein